MREQIEAVERTALSAIAAAKSLEELEAIEIQYLGRKGELTGILRGLKDLPEAQRGAVGSQANVARHKIEDALSAKQQQYETSSIEAIDITLPGFAPTVGHLHLVAEGIQDITRIFEEIGFTRIRHPEIESDWYAFEALNMPPDHPARDEWETFFMDHSGKGDERFILTPHATSGTARVLAQKKLPVRVINIQKTYRRQSDASHVPMFHQFDGLYVDEGVNFQHLRGVFEYFIRSFFGADRRIRFRPYHFRFVEPGFEIDISCAICDGKGCRLCKEGWLELGGAGMVHPNVLAAAKIDSRKYSGFAFGWGVERNVMMRSGVNIPDMRMLYENDLRFLEQF